MELNIFLSKKFMKHIIICINHLKNSNINYDINIDDYIKFIDF